MGEERMENKANMDWGGRVGSGGGGREGERERGSTKTEVGTILMIFRPPRRSRVSTSTTPTTSNTKAQRAQRA